NGGTFRVRARAHQRPKANWSDWRTFKIATLGPPACQPTKAYGATYDASATPTTMPGNQTKTVMIKVPNAGALSWPVAGNFHLSYHWLLNGQPAVYDGKRTSLTQTVSPCETTTLSATLTAPSSPGTYTLQWDMVQENVTWFSTQGVPTGNRTVTVQ